MTAASVLDARVLVLNKLYSAVRVVDARRAFTLLCKGSAEVISVESGSYVSYSLNTWAEAAEFQRTFETEEHDWVSTPNLVIAVPKIIRLLGYERLPREPVKLNRRNIYARDHSQCQYCGKHFSTKELTLDHVVPRVQGGENSWTNLVCACVRCRATAYSPAWSVYASNGLIPGPGHSQVCWPVSVVCSWATWCDSILPC